MFLLLTGNSISNGVVSEGLAFAVEKNVIKKAGEADAVKREAAGAEVIDLRRYTVLPGFIDTHIHGGSGFDTMDGNYAAINGLSSYKIKEGVTSFCPATVTASDEMTSAAINGVREAIERGVDGAKVLGIFLEGPYLNPKNKGAHPAEFIREINLPEMKALVEKARVKDGKSVVILAVAPELPGAKEAIKELTAMEGVFCRMGHSSASFAETNAGAEAGGNACIHTYNAMSALNHREPGMVGAILTNNTIYGEIICDLIHVHPAAVGIVARAKGPDKTIMITDCMSAGGLADGEYKLGELPVIVKNGVCRLADGTLAGSTATIIGCVQKMHETVGVALADAVTMATASPAKSLGIYDRVGSLDAGKQADIIAIDENFNVKFVMVDGVIKLNNI